MKVMTVSPGTPGYNDVDRAMKKHFARCVDYNLLARRYNKAEVESILLVDMPTNLRLANIARVFERRGLERDQDYSMSRPKEDAMGGTIPIEHRPVAIKKLTLERMSTFGRE